MPLDDREQRILAEIERQFYEEDPELAHAVRNIDRSGRYGVRLPLIGLVIGAVAMLASFTTWTAVAIAGFGLMVVAATALVHGIRNRGGLSGHKPKAPDGDRMRVWRRFKKR